MTCKACGYRDTEPEWRVGGGVVDGKWQEVKQADRKEFVFIGAICTPTDGEIGNTVNSTVLYACPHCHTVRIE